MGMTEGFFKIETGKGEAKEARRVGMTPVNYLMGMALGVLNPEMGKIICVVRVTGIGDRVDVIIVRREKINSGMCKLHGIIILK
jgi:hypothetical protein